jgi:hypothetical protein
MEVLDLADRNRLACSQARLRLVMATHADCDVVYQGVKDDGSMESHRGKMSAAFLENAM